MGKITESVLLGEKNLTIWSFHFLVYIKQNEGSIVYKCMCDVRACFTAILYQAYIWSSDWAPVVGTIYHLLLLRPLCYLYTRVQLQFLQDSSQAFHTKIVQINRKSTGSLKTMVCTQDRVGRVGSRWNEARLPSFRGQMQL